MKLLLAVFLLSLISFTPHAQEFDFVVDDELVAAWSEEFLGEAETEFWPGEEANFQSQAGEEMSIVLDSSTLENDAALDVAVEFLIDWGVSEGVLDAATVYTLDAVNLIEQDPLNTTFIYYYIDLRNDQGDLERFWVAVYTPPMGATTAFDPWHIQPLIIGENGMNFLDRSWPISLTWPQFNSNDFDAKDNFFWGLNEVIARAVEAGVLENDNYYVEVVYVAAVDQAPDATYYVYDTLIRPQGRLGLEALFTVRESPTGDLAVEKYVLFPAE